MLQIVTTSYFIKDGHQPLVEACHGGQRRGLEVPDHGESSGGMFS
jgi:hypothetical protein